MSLIEVHDVRFNAIDRGSGTPLVLVHGFPLDHSMWREQIDGLSDRYHVIASDLRGFGGSDVAAGIVTMDQMADDVAGILDALRVKDPIVLCGLSMGGYVAWQFALRHRRRLASLILCDTRAIADSPEVAAGRLKTAERVLSEGANVAADSLLPKLFAPATYDEQPQIVEETRQVILRTKPAGIAAALRGMAQRPDVTSALPQIDVPALVICGQHDGIAPPAEMRQIAQRLPKARFVEIEAAGHMSPLERPEPVNAAIREFLGH